MDRRRVSRVKIEPVRVAPAPATTPSQGVAPPVANLASPPARVGVAVPDIPSRQHRSAMPDKK
jgi:hypothetical protein